MCIACIFKDRYFLLNKYQNHSTKSARLYSVLMSLMYIHSYLIFSLRTSEREKLTCHMHSTTNSKSYEEEYAEIIKLFTKAKKKMYIDIDRELDRKFRNAERRMLDQDQAAANATWLTASKFNPWIPSAEEAEAWFRIVSSFVVNPMYYL